MDKSFLDNHPALQVIREDESEDENEQIQVFEDHEIFDERLSKSLYYGRETPSSDRLSLPITELCVDYFNLAGFDTTLTGQSDLDITRTRLDRLDVARAAAVSRETCVSPTSLVLALVYLERLRGSNPTYLHAVSSADLFLVSLMVASKLIHDDGEEDEVFNQEWATSAGIERKDLNRLEMEFLTNIEWNCHVSQKQFKKMTDRLEERVVQRQIDKRRGGWTTYTDINVLSKHINLQIIWDRLVNVTIQVTAVCLAAYAASLMTMLGTCYALTKANLGPSSVSQSLNTLKSAVTSSSTMITPSVGEDNKNTSVSDGAIPNLSSMDPSTLEQLISDESDTSSMTHFITSSIAGNQPEENCCQTDHLDNSLKFIGNGHYTRKPPYTRHGTANILYDASETDSIIYVLPVNFGSNGTTPNEVSHSPENENDEDEKSLNVIKNNKLCNSISSFQKILTLLDWKMSAPFMISASRYGVEHKSCSSERCQNTHQTMFHDPLADKNNVFHGSLNINQHNALFNHDVGKAIIGL